MGLNAYDQMVSIFTALLISAWPVGLHGTEIVPKAGIVFRHVGEVILSGDSWNLVGELKVAALREDLNKVRNVLNSIGNMTSTLNGGKDIQDNFNSETMALKERLGLVQNKADIFDQILREKPPPAVAAHSRRKRFLDFFFGSDDTDRLEGRIHNVEDKVSNLADVLVSFKAETTSRLNSLDTRTQENKNRIDDLDTNLKKLRDFTEKSLVLSSMMRTLGLILENIDSYVVDMLEAIHDLLQNRLSPKLVSPLEIVVALKTARRKLPESIRPLTDVEPEAVYDYYTYTSIQGYATKSSIVFYIKLPLKAEKRHFDMYRPHSFPVYHEEARAFLAIEAPGHVVLVSKLKEKAAELTSDLEQCKHLGKTYVCPAMFPLKFLQASCTLSLLLGIVNNVNHLCTPMVVSPGFAPVWVRSQYGWFYSVSETTRVTKIAEGVKTPSIYTINGTGFIADTPGFYLRINDDEEELFPSDNLGENATVHINKTGEVVIPPFSLTEVLTTSEIESRLEQSDLEPFSGHRPPSANAASPEKNTVVESNSPIALIVAVVILYFIVCLTLGYLMCGGRQLRNPLDSGSGRLALMATA